MSEAVLGRGIFVRLYALVGIADGETDVVFGQYVVEIPFSQPVQYDALVIRIAGQPADKRVGYDALLHGLKLHLQIQVPLDGHASGEHSDVLAFFLESVDPDGSAHVDRDGQNVDKYRLFGVPASFP